ncbi:MAG: PD40 domain-containing protein, partial [Sedimentisphaerales bacterium]|nr:PD40 domain-containing protein [Sedimentisphaerales bacterium]
MSTRETTNDPWSIPMSLGSTVNSNKNDDFASLSGNGLELYFSSARPQGWRDIWVTKRDSKGDNWQIPVNLGPTINSPGMDCTPWITQDGLELYLSSDRPGGYGDVDIWVATRATPNDEWGEPVNLGPPLNTAAGEYYPCLSPDGLLLFFSDIDNEASDGFRPRTGGHGQSDMWMTRRKSITDPWEEPVNLGPGMNTSSFDSQPRLSPDGSFLYFTSSRPDSSLAPVNTDIWQAPIIPIVDFNGDGMVDSADMVTMVDHWGTDNRLCDIGAMPWGDGVVDVQDLSALAGYLFEEVNDPTLIAHWELDEEEGKTAYDSVGTNDGVIIGLPQWRPKDGVVDGALELNGTTFIAFDPVLNPADGPFSVLVWVKGGGPGQVIASSGRFNWLMADAATGALMTELSDVGQNGSTLRPEAVITDGNWHRIAFTWDGANARLYVDTFLVGECAQDGLVNSSARLLLGTSMDREPGTFWSGLIDDVRIYNRVV